MKRICLKCKNEIVNLNLTQEQKIEIGSLLRIDKKLDIVKKLKDEFGFSHTDSKIIVDHLNKDFGRCGRCNYEDLKLEYIDCPKCKAFNYNLDFNIE